ncbi:30S ribosomal protein S2 [Pelagicoccus sp. SDUM812005]|uniref:30S ribosomal protein S2 n=1 Tax=Pelagicoccus sp. SDUM812005 TaxID=3041257 RepID=UPI00281008F0|nr:30S ribosomal protein S2 [Pelagicoccus sp. SDUM812005]MDQ8179599.1 30S ribosomal protein S2 [Pelagicoccus sp. SDUM812005]
MNIELTDLLDAGVHFGHQVKRWNPKSKGFVFDHRQGISVIDLAKTYEGLKKAYDFVEDVVAKGGEVLLVGTKRQAQEIIRETAANTGMPFCVNRWMGGTLTNWQTITTSIAKYKKYMAMEADGSLAKLPKKEGSAIRREMARMHRNFEGIVKMDKLPAAMFVVDVNYEDIAVAEARRVKVPVAAIVDTNSDPSTVDYAIPGNDDAVKSIRIILEAIAEAVESGRAKRASRMNQGKGGDANAAAAESVAAAEEPVAAPVQAAAEEPVAAPVKAEAPVAAPKAEEAPAAAAEEEEKSEG